MIRHRGKADVKYIAVWLWDVFWFLSGKHMAYTYILWWTLVNYSYFHASFQLIWHGIMNYFGGHCFCSLAAVLYCAHSWNSCRCVLFQTVIMCFKCLPSCHLCKSTLAFQPCHPLHFHCACLLTPLCHQKLGFATSQVNSAKMPLKRLKWHP